MIEGFEKPVEQLEYSQTLDLLATRASGGVRLWKLAMTSSGVRATELWHMSGLESRGICFDSTGKQLAVAQRSGNVVILDTKDGQITSVIRSLAKSGTELTRVIQFHPTQNELAIGSVDGKLAVWDLDKKKIRKSWFTGHSVIHAIAFSRDGRHLVTSGRNVRVWDNSDGRHLLSFQNHQQDIKTIGFDSDNERLLSGSEDGTIVTVNFQRLAAELARLRMSLSLKSDTPPVQIAQSRTAQTKRWQFGNKKELQQVRASLFYLPMAARAERAKDWGRAARHLSKVVGQRPTDKKLIQRFTTALCQQGKWKAAIKQQDLALKLDPTNLDAMYYKAIAQLADKNLDGYHKTRTEILKKFQKLRYNRSAGRVVYSCIHGNDLVDKGVQKQLMDFAVRSRQQRLIAAIHLRSKNNKEAIKILEQGKSKHLWDRLLLALAYARDGQEAPAAKLLKNAQPELTARKDDDWPSWHEREEVKSLEREVKAMLSKQNR